MDTLGALTTLGVVIAVVVSTVALRRLDRREQRWFDVLRDRFYLGVPWGTLVVITFVLGVYLFVQDGRTSWSNPVTIPYRAWSYRYPLGVVTSSFAHAGDGHLLGNLTATIVLAPLAEYAWGHYPTDDEPAYSWLASPRVRAFVIFPAVILAVGLLTGLFALGPVIGFSGVVFAFAGFAIVRYPVATVVGVLGVHGVVATVIRAIQTPILEVTPAASPPAPPSWATIAIQGHALGFLLGLLLGAALLRRRNHRPNPVHLWGALLLFGFAQGLWMIYWFGPGGSYVLLRAPGVLVVALLAVIVTAAITASDRPLLPERFRSDATPAPTSWTRRRVFELAFGSADEASSPSRVQTLATPDAERESSVRIGRRRAALGSVLLVLAAISGPAVAVNAFVVDPGDTEPTVSVEDYHVTYAEDVENPVVSIGPFDAFGTEDTITSSGVIVWSDQRHLWTDAVSADRLAFSGEETVELGGPGWRESVTADRRGWEVVGNDTVYQVWLGTDGATELAHESASARADVEVAGTEFELTPDDGEFRLELTRNESRDVIGIPDDGQQVTVGDVTVTRSDDELVASTDDTRVVIASVETYD